MEYNDELMPNAHIMAKMSQEFNIKENSQKTIEICEMSNYRQKAEIEEILRLIHYCEDFFKWLEGKDADFKELEYLIEQTESDKITTQSCCGHYRLDYRYACESDFEVCRDFNKNCKNYCKCELEILDRVIKLLALRHSIVDKECMLKLMKNRMDAFKLIFNKYCK